MIDLRKIADSSRLAGLVLLVSVIGLVLLAGCSNDPVAPQDDPPALSARDVAAQAGYVAMAAGIVGGQTVDFVGKSAADQYVHNFTGDVAGQIILDYFTAENGAPATWQDGRYVELYTTDGAPLNISVGIGGTVLLGFDVNAAIAVDRTSATINGGGSFESGPYMSSFAFDGLVVNQGNSYPGGGSLSFTSGDVTATVTFDGTSTAVLSLSTGAEYTVDLESGEIS